MTDAAPLHPPERYSPFHRLIGWEVAEWANGRAVLTCRIRDDYMNRGGNVHGGLIATLIDAAAGYAALGGPTKETEAEPVSPKAPPSGSTISLNINYVSAVREGLLTITAERTGGGKSVAFVRIEVTADEGRRVAEALCTYRLFPRKA